ncbi:LysR substrate-binding domain-containing protein [Aquabacter cavernae]|uniref:LysR substrate-binding domain-containing protein n=1 Tax=Aquabacter cavernae TaxID=2496029 RepID=UPI001FDF1A3C|nr:LysR substrate-binding domain-containing protein [Aquabacter cavernae]
MMRFDLVDLRLFLAILEAGSITAGAARAHLALASASARVQALEAQVGVPLLVRARSGARPTPAGEALGHHARLLLQQAERMQGELARFGKGLKGHLRLWSNTAALSAHLPADLAAFLARHPDIDADLEERPSAAIARALREGLIHMGVLSHAAGLAGLDWRPYGEDRLVALLPAGHGLAARGALSFADLAGEPFVGLAPGIALQEMVSGEAARMGLTLKMRVRVTSFPALAEIVAAGVGVAVLPHTEHLRLPPSLALEARPLEDGWARRRLVIATREAAALPPFARAALDALSDAAR